MPQEVYRLEARAMIGGLVEILLFQGLGEIVSKFALPLIPGPVIGLVLLLAWFRARRTVPANVEIVANGLVQHLGLLFVPAAVGVVMFWPQLRADALTIGAALVASVVATIAVSALVLKILAPEELDPGPLPQSGARDDAEAAHDGARDDVAAARDGTRDDDSA
ncbi:MAG TPA: CidA/LrgA family protein [Usitatibacter sp.]|nr:CidA/LrgA family protein [Usitatibacter sp.]